MHSDNKNNEYPLPNHPKLLCLHTILLQTLHKFDLACNIQNEESALKKKSNPKSILQSLHERSMIEHKYKSFYKKRQQNQYQKPHHHQSISGTLKKAQVEQENRYFLDMLQDLHKVNKNLNYNFDTIVDEEKSLKFLQGLSSLKSKVINGLNQMIYELKTSSSIPTLTSYIHDETVRRNKIEGTLKNIAEIEKNNLVLEEEIKKQQLSHEQQEKELTSNISTLSQELRNLEIQFAMKKRINSHESYSSLQTQARLYEMKEDNLQNQILNLQRNIDRDKKSFQHTSEYLNRKKEQAQDISNKLNEKDIENNLFNIQMLNSWNDKTRKDISNMMNKCQDLANERNKILDEITQNQQYYEDAKKNAEYAKHQYDIRIREKEIYVEKVIKCQAFVRGYLTRKHIHQKPKKVKKIKKKKKL